MIPQVTAARLEPAPLVEPHCRRVASVRHHRQTARSAGCEAAEPFGHVLVTSLLGMVVWLTQPAGSPGTVAVEPRA